MKTPLRPCLFPSGLALLVLLVLVVGLCTMAWAQPQPLDPAETEMLRAMEQASPVQGVTGGDFSLAAQQRAAYVQYAINATAAMVAAFLLIAGLRLAQARFAPKRGDEQRQWQRYLLNASLTSVHARTASGLPLQARPVDISRHGVGLELEGADGQVIKKGERINLEIVMEGGHKITLSDLTGKVCWAAGKKVGVQLNKMLDLDWAAIQEFFAAPAAQAVAVRS